ncbi:hypothetical protein NQ317_007123 [Molorchus minor]|uniref:RING-type domain-containing protein n=1 Tax=Molorchus minor TaxID=1323400 RepID=A0ABQ9JYY9_9CUCU|nr:hypothetical protein NQ317_007123 [Molorchus minor]
MEMVVFSVTKCIFCNHGPEKIGLGKFLLADEFAIHYVCLRTADGLQQNGNCNVDIHGYLLPDIIKVYKHFCNRLCVACHKSGASIVCTGCRKSFHLPCAIENYVVIEMLGCFPACCLPCYIKKNNYNMALSPSPAAQERCSICLVNLSVGGRIYWSECCQSKGFHIICLQTYAETAGNATKCPLCSNSGIFRCSIRKSGVYIPNKAAEWFREYTITRTKVFKTHCSANYCTPRTKNCLRCILVLCFICGKAFSHLSCAFSGCFMCSECVRNCWPSETPKLSDISKSTVQEEAGPLFACAKR